MLFPVRCWTCGKVIGHLWNEYNERLQIAKVSNDNLENGLEYVIKFSFYFFQIQIMIKFISYTF